MGLLKSLLGNSASLSDAQRDQCANWIAHFYAAHSLETLIYDNNIDKNLLFHSYSLFNETTRYAPDIQILSSFTNSKSFSYFSQTQDKLRVIANAILQLPIPRLQKKDIENYITDAGPRFGRELKSVLGLSAGAVIRNHRLLRAAMNIVRDVFLRQRIQGKEIILTDPIRSMYIIAYFLGKNATGGDCYRFTYEIFSNIMHPAYALVAIGRLYLAVSGKGADVILNTAVATAQLAEIEKMMRLFSWGSLKDVPLAEKMVVCTKQDADIVFE